MEENKKTNTEKKEKGPKILYKELHYIYENPFRRREAMFNCFVDVIKVKDMADRQLVTTADGETHTVLKEYIDVRAYTAT